jgi:hypothetical protein
VPPTDRPVPRFVAEPPHELEPYGRWEETLATRFMQACEALDLEGPVGRAGPITWFPERTYAARTYVPAVAPVEAGIELFGFVSFRRDDDSSDPTDFETRVDYTEETADRNPEWKIDLNDEVIGRWRGPGEAQGDLTLVWGEPLVRGGASATAELGGDTLDQCALVQSERFTLIALDAVSGLGDDLYLEIKLWNKGGELLASETLYE